MANFKAWPKKGAEKCEVRIAVKQAVSGGWGYHCALALSQDGSGVGVTSGFS